MLHVEAASWVTLWFCLSRPMLDGSAVRGLQEDFLDLVVDVDVVDGDLDAEAAKRKCWHVFFTPPPVHIQRAATQHREGE